MKKPIYLRTARERRRLTQEELAAISHVAQNTISKLETHPQARPAFPTVMALARALGVSPAALRWGPEPPVPRRRRRAAGRARAEAL
jgi:transcriptional regulator with XRE-family HTH domain